MWKNDGNHAGSNNNPQEQPEECSAGPGGLQAAAHRRPCHPPAAQKRPTSTPEAAQEQPRECAGGPGSPQAAAKGDPDIPLRAQDDAQAAEERPGSWL